MAKKILSLIALVQALSASVAFALPHPSTSCLGRTAVIFAPGILSDPLGRIDDLIELRSRVLDAIGRPDPLGGWATVPNQTGGVVVDLIEAAVNSGIPDLATTILEHSNGTYQPTPSILRSEAHVEFLRRFFDPARVTTAQDVQRHVDVYTRLVAGLGLNVVVVAHSQGNFFSNMAWSQLDPDLREFVTIVGVSPVAGPLAGGGPHVRLGGDYVTGPLATLLPLLPSLPISTENGRANHLFVRDYLDSPASEDVVDSMLEAADAMCRRERTVFLDGFHRPDVGTVGNGWSQVIRPLLGVATTAGSKLTLGNQRVSRSTTSGELARIRADVELPGFISSLDLYQGAFGDSGTRGHEVRLWGAEDAQTMTLALYSSGLPVPGSETSLPFAREFSVDTLISRDGGMDVSIGTNGGPLFSRSFLGSGVRLTGTEVRISSTPLVTLDKVSLRTGNSGGGASLFFDDFNRAGPLVGNGWNRTFFRAEAVVINGEAVADGQVEAGVARTLPAGDSVRASLTLKNNPLSSSDTASFHRVSLLNNGAAFTGITLELRRSNGNGDYEVFVRSGTNTSSVTTINSLLSEDYFRADFTVSKVASTGSYDYSYALFAESNPQASVASASGTITPDDLPPGGLGNDFVWYAPDLLGDQGRGIDDILVVVTP